MKLSKFTLTTSDRVLRRNVGGNTTYAINLYKNLERLGCLIDVVQIKTNNKFLYALAESKIVNAKKANIIHFPADTGGLYKNHVPVVTTVHGNANRYEFDIRKPLAQKLWNLRVRESVRISDLVITVSNSSKVDICESFGFSESKVHVIYHGIDHSNFYPVENEVNRSMLIKELKKTFNICEPYALFVGNLEPRKNLDSLLRATRLPQWPRELKLVVVGNYAWGDKSILQRLQDNPQVIFVGQVEYGLLGQLYRMATCFIFPSLYEGWGMPVAEASASGCPVICSDRGALKEASSGNAIYLQDPRDDLEIVNSVSKVFGDQDLRQSLSRKGIEMAKKFTWENSAKRHLESFENLL